MSPVSLSVQFLASRLLMELVSYTAIPVPVFCTNAAKSKTPKRI